MEARNYDNNRFQRWFGAGAKQETKKRRSKYIYTYTNWLNNKSNKEIE